MEVVWGGVEEREALSTRWRKNWERGGSTLHREADKMMVAPRLQNHNFNVIE
jgi:hypothetical protein